VTAAAELIDRATAAGLELIDAGSRLRVRGPAPLPAELLEALRERKREVLELLRGRSEPATAGDATRALESETKASIGASSRLDPESSARWLADFNAAGLVVEICSAILNESFILAGDGATVDPEQRRRGLAVYRASELLRLLAMKPDVAALRQIHAAKRMFGGSILPS
jgi:hypothetical protein